MQDESQKPLIRRSRYWPFVLLLIMVYFLSIIPVQIVCLYNPPSETVDDVLDISYLPVIYLMQSYPWIRALIEQFTVWLISLWRP